MTHAERAPHNRVYDMMQASIADCGGRLFAPESVAAGLQKCPPVLVVSTAAGRSRHFTSRPDDCASMQTRSSAHLRSSSMQCAAAAIMLDSSAVLNTCAASVECAVKHPAMRRYTDAAVKLPPSGTVIISGKPHTRHRVLHKRKHRLRTKRMTLQKLFLGAGGDDGGFDGPPDDGGGGWSGGGDDGDAGSGGRWGSDDGDWMDGGGGARDTEPLCSCLLWGRYYETTWLWYVCCLACLTNTWWHLHGRQARQVCAA